jgi:hypothetical protein
VAQLPSLPRQLRSTQVIARFCLRMIILGAFAAFGSIGFGKSLAALLCMSVVLSAVIGTVRREVPFGIILNHWDEMAAYAALYSLVSSFNQAVPA